MNTIALTIIGSVLSISMLVIAILNYVSKQNEQRQNKDIQLTELTMKLANIEKELIEIKSMLTSNCERNESLEKRVFILENKPKRKKEN